MNDPLYDSIYADNNSLLDKFNNNFGLYSLFISFCYSHEKNLSYTVKNSNTNVYVGIREGTLWTVCTMYMKKNLANNIFKQKSPLQITPFNPRK